MDVGVVRGLATVFAMLAFIGVLVWAWSARARKGFQEAAQLPLEEDDDLGGQGR